MKWHIGCSGFHYKDWKGSFYPVGLKQKNWFDFYSSRFDTLELNVTFYRFPRLNILQNWYTKSGAGFSFSVKAPRLITHYKQLRDCEKLLDDFFDTVLMGLKEKLGIILFQMPPQWNYRQERLELLIKSMRPGVQIAVEFRHASWWNKEVYKKLEKAGIIFTGISYPDLPDAVIINNKTVYYRFHGIPDLYYSVYKLQALKKIADSILKNKKVKQVYVYFNNTATMGAINNALWIKEYLKNK
ncbi:MAG: hypothetical protein JWM28_4098 [Chitinophagaceae bacterium]|nr:hypothetical protein [Chitinophagaceae bacterium]